jgi:pyridoxal 5'-phosphate synthase pdxT subunit
MPEPKVQTMKIGILALQGAFREHAQAVTSLGADAALVKRNNQLADLDGLIVPGGESTSMGRLLREYDLIGPIREKAAKGFPVFGTCAGMIVLANKIQGADGEEEAHLGLMEVEVSRNSFGRQKDSFETDLDIPAIGDQPFPAVFIRAPHILSVGPDVEVLGTYEDRVVAVRQGHLLALSFHPELTGDNRLHSLFLEAAKEHTAVKG